MQQILPTEPYAFKHIHKLSKNVRSTDAKTHTDQNKLFRPGKTSLQSRDRTHDFRVMLNYRRTEPYMTYQSKKEQIPEYV